jgi:hypothetical protein
LPVNIPPLSGLFVDFAKSNKIPVPANVEVECVSESNDVLLYEFEDVPTRDIETGP